MQRAHISQVDNTVWTNKSTSKMRRERTQRQLQEQLKQQLLKEEAAALYESLETACAEHEQCCDCDNCKALKKKVRTILLKKLKELIKSSTIKRLPGYSVNNLKLQRRFLK